VGIPAAVVTESNLGDKRSPPCSRLEPVPSRVSSSRFVGRRAELTRLEGIWKTAVNDETAAVLLVSGEAGVGKTRLLAELKTRVGNPALVLSGQCMELVDRALPFGPIVQALRTLHRSIDAATLEAVIGPAGEELAALVPELHARASSEAVGTSALFEQLLGVLERLGDRVPTLLVIEDLHWADRSTIDLFVFLARSLRDARVVVLGTYRSDDLNRRHPLRAALAELDRAGVAERIALMRFDRDELRELITAIVGDDPSVELLEHTFERSDGNAFFAEELLATQTAPGGALPASLRGIVLARVDTLSEDARLVLRSAAVIGRRVDHRLLAATVTLSEAALLDALRECVEQQVLVAEDLEYRFRHALVHEAVYDDLLPGDRVALHSRVAAVLAEQPSWTDVGGSQLASELACHWYAAHDSDRALTASLEAARAAEQMYAYPEALAHVERALELWAQVADAERLAGMRHIDAVRYAATQAEMAGSTDRALDFIRAAADEVDPEADPVTAGLVHERWGRYLWILSHAPEELLPHLDEAARLVPDEPTPERARVLATRGQQLMLAEQLVEAVEVCEQAIAIAQQIRDKVAEGHARNTLGSTLAGLGKSEAGLEQLHLARELAEQTRSWMDVARAAVNEGGALQSLARYEEALQISLAGAALARERGLDRYFGAFLRLNACEALWLLGRWNEMEEQLREVDATQPIGIDVWRSAEAWSQLYAGVGDFDAARGAIDALRSLFAPSVTDKYRAICAMLDATCALWSGDPGGALELVQVGVALPGADTTLCADEGVGIPLLLCGAAAAADLGDAPAARAFGATLDRWVASERWFGGRPGALEVVTAQLEGEGMRAAGTSEASTWASVAGGWERYGVRTRTAYARWREAEAHLASGDRERAAAAAAPAYALARDIGWVWVRDGVASLGRRARLDIGLGDVEPPSPAERLGLTARELEVLALVAEGRTNRQIAQSLFISAKTASVHVSNILAKLGVANRGEAGAAARRLGLDRAELPA
jgi:predicted ATPase/DNA-binding CsgD family transcriptional regulator